MDVSKLILGERSSTILDTCLRTSMALIQESASSRRCSPGNTVDFAALNIKPRKARMKCKWGLSVSDGCLENRDVWLNSLKKFRVLFVLSAHLHSWHNQPGTAYVHKRPIFIVIPIRPTQPS